MWRMAGLLVLGLACPALAGEPEIDWKGRDGLAVRLSLPGHVEAQRVALTVSFAAAGESPEAVTAALRQARDGFAGHLAAAGFADAPLTETEAEVKPARGGGFEGKLEVEVELPLAGDLFDVLAVVATGSPAGYSLSGYRHPALPDAMEALRSEALASARSAAEAAAAAEGRALGELREVKFSDPPRGGGRVLDFELTLEAEFAAPKP